MQLVFPCLFDKFDWYRHESLYVIVNAGLCKYKNIWMEQFTKKYNTERRQVQIQSICGPLSSSNCLETLSSYLINHTG